MRLSKTKPQDRPHSSTGQGTKEIIIWKAYQVFREKGYHATTMADLGEACGLLKGSIYHYFPSKEELMKQVLERAHSRFKEHVFSLAYRNEMSAKMCLQHMLDKMEVVFFDGQGGCLMGNIGLETAGRETSFTRVIHHFFEEWIEVHTHLFEACYQANKAGELARQSVSDLQGALMLSCIFKDKKYFSLTAKKIVDLLA
jgi:TetR/AcrR family transcriptional repressor of nem operon